MFGILLVKDFATTVLCVFSCISGCGCISILGCSPFRDLVPLPVKISEIMESFRLEMTFKVIQSNL